MVTAHDSMSLELQTKVLQDIRKGSSDWKDLFSSEVTLVKNSEWPLTDGIIKDDLKKIQCAIEFKPFGHGKREYLTGLGQAIAYLDTNDFSLYFIPSVSNDGFPIGEYVSRLLNLDLFSNIPVGIIIYDDKQNLVIKRKIPKVERKLQKKTETSETFWAFWREASLHEIFLMLDKANSLFGSERNIKKEVTDWLNDLKVNGKTRDPEGLFRKIGKKGGGESKDQTYRNYSPFFNGLGLWDSTGYLTSLGLDLLRVGKIYGYDSTVFRDELAKKVLKEGNHLQLILLIEKFQYGLYKDGKLTAQNNNQFDKMIEQHLEDNGLLKRCAGRRTTSLRKRLQSELTLWHWLDLIETHKNTYFIKDVGYKFKWDRITSILS